MISSTELDFFYSIRFPLYIIVHYFCTTAQAFHECDRLKRPKCSYEEEAKSLRLPYISNSF